MSKRLIVCADGTWNTPEQQEEGVNSLTNVAKIARKITPAGGDGVAQVVYYLDGVGTNGGVDRWTGGALGKGLDDNIEAAYKFLVDNYADGDALYLFGFSRGAYTVRSLAGLIRNCGLLQKQHADRVTKAMQLYRDRKPDSHPNSSKAKSFRRKYSRDAKIKFIGVWDTVGALGVPMFNLNRRYQFHDVELSSSVENAFHALAIDEQREPFLPALWSKQRHAQNQRVEQIWFAGVHANVGGGYKDSRLSDIPLMWMRTRAEECGLEFDDQVTRALNIKHPNRHGEGTLYNSRRGFYRVVRSAVREIGEGPNGTESIHATAVARLERQRNYRPQNLAAALGKGVTVVGD